ncbi:Profilin-4 [Irineochytrium annulatum]|nr:Profilin-4 [Irineochytrium annulatum]
MTPQDWSKIQMAFDNPKEVRTAEAAITLMDVAYRAVRADNLSVYAKNDKSGVIVARTHSHFILGTYDASMFASVAAEAIEKLGTSSTPITWNLQRAADYFRKKNK